MQAFSAVVSTGIYCRPGCSAQPLARNVREFPIAAAAEAAGFRACLRCRPYRLPSVAGLVEPEIVCRAVRLVLDGALDDGAEAALADRLGVSGRHLRRLFVARLGVTPDGLARSARVHFARRLLDETALTITEVAFAAGFGSPRQFNRVCREVFRASPSDLRVKRRRSDRLVADGGLALRLIFHGPLDWPATAGYLARTAVPGVEYVSGEVYRRTVRVAGDPGVLELLPGGDDHLIVRAHLPHWEGLLHVVQRVRRIASLDADLVEPVLLLGRDPVVGPLVRARPGVRVPGTWDAFEVGVGALAARPETPSESTRAVLGRIVERYGTPVAGLGELGLTHTFPGPGVLAAADLSGIGLTAATAAAVRAFAAATVGGAVRLDGSASYGELLASLGAVPGVGSRTAQYVAFRLGEPDAFPLSDHQLAGRLAVPAGSTRASRTAVAERWRPWRGLAVAHLWAADGPGESARKGAA